MGENIKRRGMLNFYDKSLTVFDMYKQKYKKVFKENTNRKENILNRDKLNPRDLDMHLNPEGYY